MRQKELQNCEACLPFNKAEDFRKYIDRKDFERELAQAIEKNNAIRYLKNVIGAAEMYATIVDLESRHDDLSESRIRSEEALN